MSDNLQIIVAAYDNRIYNFNVFINSFLLQTHKNFILHIVHDGAANQALLDLMHHYSRFCDLRFECIDPPTGVWGHLNRKTALEKLDPNEGDKLLITNFDNYYVPVFVEYINKTFTQDVDLVYYDFVHSHQGYMNYKSVPEISKIDMGAFITRSKLAKDVGFNSTHYCADGVFIEDYKKRSNGQACYIDRTLFVHN